MAEAQAPPKLYYFGLPGRGEQIRLAFVAGEVDFIDERVGNWKELKPTTPWGSMPFLEFHDGTRIAQTRNCLRLAGKLAGLYPEDPIQAAQCDEITEACEDCLMTIIKCGQGLEGEAKETARRLNMTEGAGYAILQKLNAYVGQTGSNGFAVGDSLTVADLSIFSYMCHMTCQFFDGVPKDCVNGFENLMAIRFNVANVPTVAAFYAAEQNQGAMRAYFACKNAEEMAAWPPAEEQA